MYTFAEAALEVDSKLTARSQTTIPAPGREALQLTPGKDRIHYEILPGGKVVMSRLAEDEEDPIINAFLAFLAKDMEENPSRLQPLNMNTFEQGRSLIAGMTVNTDDEITDDE